MKRPRLTLRVTDSLAGLGEGALFVLMLPLVLISATRPPGQPSDSDKRARPPH